MNMGPFISRAKGKLKEYTLPTLILIPIFALVLYYTFKFADRNFYTAHSGTFKEVFSIALAILSGGIFLAVMKWIQFMGFFREEILAIFGSSEFDEKLQKSFYEVLYSDDFLKKQNDLEKIWKRVTHCYFKSEFPEDISDKVNSKLEEVFFHNNHLSHFYRNYFIDLLVDLDGDGYLTITETTEVRIIRPALDSFTYDFSYFITRRGEDDEISDVQYEYLKVNQKPIDLLPLVTTENEGASLVKKALVKLQGRKEYLIASKVILKYHIDTDPEYKFFSERIIDYVRAEIKCSHKLLKMYFIPIGNEEFRSGEAADNELVKIYDDLLLPEKGFRVIFTRNSHS